MKYILTIFLHQYYKKITINTLLLNILILFSTKNADSGLCEWYNCSVTNASSSTEDRCTKVGIKNQM